MAPMPDDSIDGKVQKPTSQSYYAKTCATDRLKDVIQNLFEIQSAVHGYLGPETQQQLVRKVYADCTLLGTRRFG